MCYSPEELCEVMSPNITVTRSPPKMEAMLPGGVSIVPVRKSLKRDSMSPSPYEEPRKMAKMSLPNSLNGSVVITSMGASNNHNNHHNHNNHNGNKPVPKLRPIAANGTNGGHSSTDEYDEPLDVSQFLSISMQPQEEEKPAAAPPQHQQQQQPKKSESSVLESLQRRNAALHAELRKRDGVIKDLRMRLSSLNSNVDSTVIEFLKRYFDNTAFQVCKISNP
jgi:hypothetical protein